LAETETSSQQLFRVDCIIIGLVVATSVIASLVNITSNSIFPIINEKIFEQLIQVNATILGFSIVGIYFYYGKFDASKKTQIDLITDALKESKKPSGKGDDVSDDTSANNDESVELDLSGFVNTLNDAFDKTEDLIKRYTTIIIIFYAIGITVSFLSMFFFANGYGQYTWSIIIINIALIIATTYYYRDFWNQVRLHNKIIDKLLIEHLRAISRRP
jgi:hypothetical protein